MQDYQHGYPVLTCPLGRQAMVKKTCSTWLWLEQPALAVEYMWVSITQQRWPVWTFVFIMLTMLARFLRGGSFLCRCWIFDRVSWKCRFVCFRRTKLSRETVSGTKSGLMKLHQDHIEPPHRNRPQPSNQSHQVSGLILRGHYNI